MAIRPLNEKRQTVRTCLGCGAAYKSNKNSRETHCNVCRGLVPHPMYAGNRLPDHMRR